MYTQSNTNHKRYFPTQNYNHFSSHERLPKHTNKYIESRIMYGSQHLYGHNRFQPQPQFLSTSSRLTQMNQKLVDDTNLMRKRSSSRRKKIFENKQTRSLLRSSGARSLESNTQSMNSRQNFIQYCNPIYSKIPSRSRSKQKMKISYENIRRLQTQRSEKQKQIERERQREQVNMKVPILFSYSSPQNFKSSQASEKKKSQIIYKTNITDMMKKPAVFKSMQLRESNLHENPQDSLHSNTFNPNKEGIRSPMQYNMKESSFEGSKFNIQKCAEEEFEDDRFFDMDFKTEAKNQSNKSTEKQFLSPITSNIMERREQQQKNFVTNLQKRLTKLFLEADDGGKLITIILVVLGVILVIFQAIK